MTGHGTRGGSEPIVYIDHSQIREGSIDELKAGVQRLVDFIDAREPQQIAYGFYIDDEAIEMMVERGTWLVPTLSTSEGILGAISQGIELPEEGVRQMRGTSTAQVAGADTCLVTSGEGVPTSALLLRA